MARPKFVQAKITTLKVGISATETTEIILKSVVDIYGNEVAFSTFGTTLYLTLNPGGDNEEVISCTGFTRNSDGSVTLDTGIVRGLAVVTPYASGGSASAHAAGTVVIVGSDTPQLLEQILDYIDELSLSGAVAMTTTDVGYGEKATAAEIDADTENGSVGPLVVTPDQLALSKYAANPLTDDEKAALAGGSTFGTPSTSNKFITQDYVANGTRTTYNYAGSPHTWTKKTGLLKIFVQCWGAGASGNVFVGSSGADEGVGGGGGGAYIEKWFAASELGATETITVGAGGAAVTSGVGNNGGDTTFGSLLTADGGYAGTSFYTNGGNGGIVLFEATVGGQTSETSSQNAYFGGGSGARGASTETASGGGSSFYGGGGGGGATTAPGVTNGGGSFYGGGGGGGAANAGGNATATSGSVPGGGGGGAYAGTTFTATSGAGGNGRCIVTEFYA